MKIQSQFLSYFSVQVQNKQSRSIVNEFTKYYEKLPNEFRTLVLIITNKKKEKGFLFYKNELSLIPLQLDFSEEMKHIDLSLLLDKLLFKHTYELNFKENPVVNITLKTYRFNINIKKVIPIKKEYATNLIEDIPISLKKDLVEISTLVSKFESLDKHKLDLMISNHLTNIYGIETQCHFDYDLDIYSFNNLMVLYKNFNFDMTKTYDYSTFDELAELSLLVNKITHKHINRCFQCKGIKIYIRNKTDGRCSIYFSIMNSSYRLRTVPTFLKNYLIYNNICETIKNEIEKLLLN